MRPDSSEDSLTQKVCIRTAHGVYASEEAQNRVQWKSTSTRTTRDPSGLKEPCTLDWTLQRRPDDQQPPIHTLRRHKPPARRRRPSTLHPLYSFEGALKPALIDLPAHTRATAFELAGEGLQEARVIFLKTIPQAPPYMRAPTPFSDHNNGSVPASPSHIKHSKLSDIIRMIPACYQETSIHQRAVRFLHNYASTKPSAQKNHKQQQGETHKKNVK